MSKFMTVMKREYAQVVKKKSFVVGIILTPTILVGMMIIPSLMSDRGVDYSEKIAIIDRSGMQVGQEFADALDIYKLSDSTTAAYTVSGLIDAEGADSARFAHLYDSLAAAVSNEQVRYVLSIGPQPHLADSQLVLVTNSDNRTSIRRFEQRLWRVISGHRLEVGNVNLPVDSVLTLTSSIDIEQRDTMGEAIPYKIKIITGIIFTMMIYIMILMWGQFLMRSIIEEKSSRIMEVLVSSVTPFQLMMGKLIGMGAAAFTQVGVWVAIGIILFFTSGTFGFAVDSGLSRMVFNPVVAVFFLLLFTSGYVLYSAIFSLIGSIVNTDKEAQNFILPVILPLLLSFMLTPAIGDDPYAPWVMFLCFFPLTAPTLQMSRIAIMAPSATEYSMFSGILAEATLSFLSIVVASIGLIWLASRVFRVGILMYGKRPTFSEIIKWIRH